jgi:hypothetical protein
MVENNMPPTIAVPTECRPSLAGHPERTTAGLVTADTSGTHSIPEECAPPAFIIGLQPSASSVATGRCIPTGMLIRENGRRSG